MTRNTISQILEHLPWVKCLTSVGESKLKACKMLADLSGPQSSLGPGWRQVCSAGTRARVAQCSQNAAVQGPACHLLEEDARQGMETSPFLKKIRI